MDYVTTGPRAQTCKRPPSPPFLHWSKTSRLKVTQNERNDKVFFLFVLLYCLVSLWSSWVSYFVLLHLCVVGLCFLTVLLCLFCVFCFSSWSFSLSSLCHRVAAMHLFVVVLCHFVSLSGLTLCSFALIVFVSVVILWLFCTFFCLCCVISCLCGCFFVSF